MKKRIAILIVVLVLMLVSAGCEEYLIGAGIATAGSAALDATEIALVAEEVKLQEQYEGVILEVENAPDANSLTLAEKKLDIIQNSRLVNKAALHTVRQIKVAKNEKTPQGRADALLVGGIGIIGLAFEEWRRRLMNKKYVSMKVGQARLKTENPEAEAKLYALVGEARRNLGL